MANCLPLLNGHTTLESALASNDDMRLAISYPQNQHDFYAYLNTHRPDIEHLVSIHLGLDSPENCRLAGPHEWMRGNFNVCIPVYVANWIGSPRKRVLIRFALPYKLGESQYPGNVEEKLRCEAATFIWIKQYCPDVPIPRLWGFGFPDGRIFTTSETDPADVRPPGCSFIGRQYERSLKVGYLIMDYIEDSEGKPLSKSWTDLPRDSKRRANFFADLSRIMLSLSRTPLPRIGSITINDDGVLLLSNRPLTFRLQQLENKGITLDMHRTTTYSTAEAYFIDLLSCHDSRIRHQPNSIRDQCDGETQLSVLAAMHALLPHFVTRASPSGPFAFTLTDIHPNNVFVDDDWHITCLIDLEWACVRPAEMILPPVWLTGRRVDQLPRGDHLDAYFLVLEEFFDAFAREELLFSKRHGDALVHSKTLRQGFEAGSFWYFHALDNPKVMGNLFFQHIEPMFSGVLNVFDGGGFGANLMAFWGRDAGDIIAAKLKDKEQYENQLRVLFESI